MYVLAMGLKLKTIRCMIKSSLKKEENSSTVSIEDLKELQNTNMPVKSKKRNNTISLDI